MNSVLMTGEIPGLFAKDEMMAMTADLRNSFLKVIFSITSVGLGRNGCYNVFIFK